MNQSERNSTLLNETNWTEIVSNIHDFPFRISEIKQVNKEIKLSAVSFKYNLCGKETYFNGNKEINLGTGDYLIASNQQYCEVNIETQATKDLGICIDINTNLLKEAVDTFLNPNALVDHNDKRNFYLEDIFFIRYQSNKFFHQYMQSLFDTIKSNEKIVLEELECDFIQQFLFHQTPHLLAYKKVPVIKKSTRSELYTRMMQAKNILQDSCNGSVSMKEVAKQVLLSEFRFYHLFKETFQVSPHQYFMQLKMNKALELFSSKKYTWTDIAEQLSFSDVQAFSKSFKKQLRISPSQYGKIKN